ncbi:PAS domain S-box protein [Candidatus Peregrinibacteria bacterium]|nr:PAS domain S-box protein [Candidatus Peregrinibacteria bacterium]
MENGNKQRSRILIAEDEAIIAKDLQSSLTDTGYKVLGVAQTGQEAVEMAKEFRPDLILMDIVLKGKMDGIEAAQKIHDRFDIPVVFLTSYADEEKMERAKGSEPYAYILKPFNIKELQIAIELALHKHRIGYYVLFEHTGAATCIIEPDKTLSLVNSKFEQLSGYSKKELEGKKKWSDFVTKKDLTRMKKYHAERRKKGGKAPAYYEFDFIDRQKNIKRILLAIGMIPNTKRSVASLLDITERSEAGKEVKMLSSVVRQSTEGVAIADLNGYIIFNNEAWSKMHGCKSPKALIGKNLSIFHSKEQLKHDVKPFNEKVFKFGSHKGEVGHITKGGKSFPTLMSTALLKDDQGKPYAIAGIAKDVTKLKKAEKELWESEEKYKNLVEGAPDILLLINKKGDFIDFNNKFTEESGYSRKEMLGENVFTSGIVTKGSAIKIAYHLKGLAVGKEIPAFEVEGVKKDGNIIPYELKAVPVKKGGKITSVLAILRNITERHKADQALKESEEKWRSVLENAPNYVMILDRDHVIRFINHAIPGHSVEQTVGKKIYSFIAPQYHNIAKKVINQVFKTGKIGRFESKVMIPKAGDFWFESYVGSIKTNGKIQSVTLMHIDVTERKKMEDQLKKSHAELERRVEERTRDLAKEKSKAESLLESIGEGLLAIDLKGRIMIMNRVAEVLFNAQAKNCIGNLFTRLGRWEDEKGNVIRSTSWPIANVARGKKQLHVVTYFVQKDGSKLPLSTTVSPILFEGDVLGAIGAFRDITKEMEVDQAKNEFISLASHQLRTPLTGIKWLIQTVLRRGNLNAWQVEFLEDAIKSNDRMISLVNDLLNISRLEAGVIAIEPKKTDLSVFLEELIRGAKIDSSKKAQKIQFKKSRQKIIIPLDQVLIGQVINNLFSNAIKYSDAHKTITVSVKKKEEEEEVDISVADQGIGFTKKDQSKLFTKFFRSEKASKISTTGSGLGLYIVKKIMDASGGKISCRSLPKGGSVFTITLPYKGMARRKGRKPLIAHRMS